ncbi:5-oxoprolinase subunit C family protein [Paracoccus aminophilus]|uniref:Allophanate hydrolase subunit 2 n=1 Tax=Paracoccus aminophilus JCM 7686 TaxID=1367847 RepID=S5XYN9_PARAH|nr:biotin-dependent carboxyltransferase family protein [Paracoccus aminophilus]AGT08540.1 allophanate hydrolase subunit 2 [Paracoccus aminophilus JCM 7686]
MTLTVVAAGPMLTVQDRGRRGYRGFGVSNAGPMDPPALALANALCGNGAEAAALEFAGFGGSFTSDAPLRFAVMAGDGAADCAITIDGVPRAFGESHRLRPGETLRLGALRGAMWGYLAVSGGIGLKPVMGSQATHLRSGLGGLSGRALIAGDELPLAQDDSPGRCLRLDRAQTPAAGPIRVVLGPQDDSFAPEVLARLLEQDWQVSPQCDRMAMVLIGPDLPAAHGHDIVSDATVPGSIQVPPSGQPMVLMAESQTTGGYPKIATVIQSDLPRLAQMAIGTRFRILAVSRDEAEEIWIAHSDAQASLLADLRVKPEGVMSSSYLLSCDLVGGIYAPEEIVRPVEPQPRILP